MRRELIDRVEAYSKLSSTERNIMEIIPYLSVFCLWNMSRDVAQSLSKPISSLFYKDDEITFAPALDVVKRGKRKQLDISEMKDTSDCIPNLPGDLCIQIVTTVLRGSDPSSLLIRNSLVSCEESIAMLSNALEKATVAAEEIISGSASCHCYEKDSIELILSACEAFGRLSIHKEAYKHDAVLDLNPQAKSLLRWLSKRAIPSIVLKLSTVDNSSPFKNLNLSRISAIGTRESGSLLPLSPLILQPPRRRSNVNTTPSKVDTSFISMERQGGSYIVRSDFGNTQKALVMVIALLKSALAFFGDWLKVGGQGSEDIISNVKEWMKIFNCNMVRVDAKLELLPSFCRFLAVVTGICSDISLLNELFNLDFSDTTNEYDDCMEDAFKHILGNKTIRERHLIDIVLILVNKLYSHGSQEEPTTLERFIDGQNAAVKTMLKTVISSNIGLLTLTETLSQKVSENTTQVCSVHEKLLILLLDHYKHQQSIFGQLKQSVFRHISTHETESFESIRSVLRDEITS